MRRLIYVSRSLIGADSTVLATIVRRSCARNASNNVTGMLWFDGANFAQVLEGEHDCVGETMERIRADVRHADIDIVLDRDAKTRAFGNWGMTQPDDGPDSISGTAFMVGLSIASRDRAAKRLYDIVLACDE